MNLTALQLSNFSVCQCLPCALFIPWCAFVKCTFSFFFLCSSKLRAFLLVGAWWMVGLVLYGLFLFYFFLFLCPCVSVLLSYLRGSFPLCLWGLLVKTVGAVNRIRLSGQFNHKLLAGNKACCCNYYTDTQSHPSPHCWVTQFLTFCACRPKVYKVVV